MNGEKLRAEVIKLIEVKQLRAVLKEQEEQLQDAIAAEMGREKRATVLGIGVIEKRAKKERKAWKHAELQSALRRLALEHRIVSEDGEVLSTDEAVFKLLTDTANPSWRVTELKALGIDPDEYCEATFKGGYTIQLPSGLNLKDLSGDAA